MFTAVAGRGGAMQATALYTTFRILSHAILLLLTGAVCYAVAISIVHWSGIGV
jgi:hypothetical protein